MEPLPQLQVIALKRKPAKSPHATHKFALFDAYPMDENYQEEGFSPFVGFRWYNNHEALTTEFTPLPMVDSEQPEFSDRITLLVHPHNPGTHSSPHRYGSSPHREFSENLFMLPLEGPEEIYTESQLLLCKKFERVIKTAESQLLGSGCNENAFQAYKKQYFEGDEWMANYFSTDVQNIAVFIGAYDAFRDELARRGFLTDPNAKSTVYNVKFCVRLADAHWDTMSPFEYVNHIHGIIHLTVKGELLRTVMQDGLDIDGISYCPRAYRVVTVSEKTSKISIGSNDETTQFLKEFIYLEAGSVASMFICGVETFKLEFQINDPQEVVKEEATECSGRNPVENHVGSDSEEPKGYSDKAAKEAAFLADHPRIYSSLHILRHFLQNTAIEGYPVVCAQVCAPEPSEILLLIPGYPCAYPIPNFVREFETYNLKESRYQEALKLLSLQELYLEAKFLLVNFEKQRQESSIDGNMNVWICKPSQKSRGRGIFASNRLDQLMTLNCDQPAELPAEGQIDNDDSYIIEKYIERPLLIHGYKFDIRQWVLISSVNPLIIWEWTLPYLRFCSEAYKNGDFSNPFIHLSNNSVEKHCETFGNSIDGNMWHFHQMCDYIEANCNSNVRQGALTSKYDTSIRFTRIGDRILYDMARIAITTIEAARFEMSEKNGFELLGYDFLIDEDLQVWLLEINASPTMEYSTGLVQELIEKMAVGYIGIITDGFCGRRIRTDGYRLFPKILKLKETIPTGIDGWSLIWKEDSRIKEEYLMADLFVQSREIRLPRYIEYKE